MMEMVMTLTVVAVELWRGQSDFWQRNDSFVVLLPLISSHADGNHYQWQYTGGVP
jgi:hypothetical protein